MLQIATGPLSDRWGRKGLIVAGMWVQAGGAVPDRAHRATSAGGWSASLLLGLGTAMVYPSLIAAVSDASHPSWRARSLSVYRFWRDLGYAIGALSAGLIADLFGFMGHRRGRRAESAFTLHDRGIADAIWLLAALPEAPRLLPFWNTSPGAMMSGNDKPPPIVAGKGLRLAVVISWRPSLSL